ncbi:MAG: phage portal protein, partial [Alistipes sp.]|nr:phage portal protein [Alistipes sp.]
MSDNVKSWRVAATRNRAEPLFSLGMVTTAASDKVWQWGGDNMLPYALSLIARNSAAHRRIINDKAGYIAGKGVAYDESVAVIKSLVSRVNGSGDTLRNIISRLALDEVMFGNAFMEVVTDAK